MAAQPVSLRIAIVGAGIAGLTAAAAFRKEGHDVAVFESSALNKEIGAAIALSANSLRVLAYLGFEVRNLRAVDYLGVTWFDSQGGEGKLDRLHDPRDTFGKPGIQCHRSELHEELKRLATMVDAPGKPAVIHLKSEVASCDPAAATLTLANGDVHRADVLVGADGIHSTIRTSVLGYRQIALPSQRAAFRCLLDAAKLDGSAKFDWLRSGVSGARGVRPADGSGRYLFIFPCRDDTLINIVAHLPDARDQDKFGNDFAPRYTALFELVDGPVHLWQIRALPCLPTWIRARAALAGDAAHATFPTIGQGAGMSIEDAVTLACLLPLGTPAEQVPARLEAYQTLRKQRGEFVLTEAVEQVTVPSKRGLYSRSLEMQAYMIGHDAIAVAKEYVAAHFPSV
ncbi:hypothetical protein GGX14DRAFT_563285 [Mycena pura]|uniref:FAD-binding domain-containing protein n=1 Tax=Mycena pura TaxID=153505 RepID=A0AAD6VN27_9AGAR|nr:hypothetical protein GGX14DRAFT_563285 [Mycena pura]